MAKMSAIENNKKKLRMINSRVDTRAAIKRVINDKNTGFEERVALVHKLAEMPRNSSKVRYRRRCAITGRSRGVYRFFELSRVSLREFASAGLLPGVVKASW